MKIETHVHNAYVSQKVCCVTKSTKNFDANTFFIIYFYKDTAFFSKYKK